MLYFVCHPAIINLCLSCLERNVINGGGKVVPFHPMKRYRGE